MNTVNKNQHTETPVYVSPTITTFTAEELLEIVGPVQAGNDQGDMGPMGPSGSLDLHKILKVV